MRGVIAALCAAALALSGSMPTLAAPHWTPYRSEPLGFGAAYPGAPQVRATPKLTSVMVEASAAEYAVMVSERAGGSPDDPERYLDAAVIGATQGMTARFVSKAGYGGFPGREFIAFDDGKVVRLRMILHGARLYQIAVLAHARSLPDDTDDFINSFLFTD